jgi:predicted ATPase
MNKSAAAATSVQALLARVEIKNYACFRHLDVPLRPLTVLIGPNNTGKTLFLKALKKLLKRDYNFEGHERFRKDPSLASSISGSIGSGSLTVTPGKVEGSFCTTVEMFSLPSTGVVMNSGGYTDEGEAIGLESDGKNVAGLLDHFLRRDRKRFFAFVDALKGQVPGLEDVEIGTPDANTRRIDLTLEKKLVIPADQASAGVRLLIFFVALAYHPTPPQFILIEEPENGVHPKRLAEIIRFLREMTRGQHGDKPSQVVLTTHSPYLLDCIDVETDQVLIFRREDDGSRTAVPADEARLKTFLDEFKLGEVWYNEGEEGLCPKKG